MKSIYNRKIILVLLFVLIVFRTINLPFDSGVQSPEGQEVSKIIFLKKATDSAPILLQRLQVQFELGINLHMNTILDAFIKRELILTTLFILIILLIDTRKRIIRLITSYFQGSKYKERISFLITEGHIYQVI